MMRQKFHRRCATTGLLTLDPDAAPSRLTLNVDAAGLDVITGTGVVKPLTNGDRTEIKGNIAKKILQTSRLPEIRAVSTSIQSTVNGSHAVVGVLTLTGVTRPLSFQLEVAADGDGGTALSASAADRAVRVRHRARHLDQLKEMETR